MKNTCAKCGHKFVNDSDKHTCIVCQEPFCKDCIINDDIILICNDCTSQQPNSVLKINEYIDLCSNTLCPIVGSCKRGTRMLNPDVMYKFYKYTIGVHGIHCEGHIEKETITTSSSTEIKV